MSAFTWPWLPIDASKIQCDRETAGWPLASPAFAPIAGWAETMTRRRLRQLTPWLPVVCFVAVLAVESTSLLSSQHTSGPLHRLLESVFGGRVDENWSLLHHLIRKTGHFVGYGIFGLLCRRAWKRSRQMLLESGARLRHAPWLLLSPAAFGILATVMAASADELHQHFVPGRTGAFHDVLLDASGAVSLQIARVGFGLVSGFCLRQGAKDHGLGAK